jgi:ABC-type nitrate/sulfonate/bicarbonate transport system permease component
MQSTAPSASATKAGLPLGTRLLRAVRSPRAARITFPIAVLLAWQLIAPLIPSRILPMPAEVAEEMWNLLRDGVIVEAFSVSLLRLAVGFAFALVVGTVLGIAMGVFPRVEAMLHDFVVVGLAFPYLIWGLLVAMWFGFDGKGPIIVVFIAALPYVMRNLVLPSLSPFFFASLRYGLANGWKGLVLAEVFSATSGAGYTIESLADYGNFAGVIAVSFYFAIFSIIVERLVFGRLSTRVFRWRPSIAAEVTEMPETAQ